MTAESLRDHLRRHWLSIREKLLARDYEPLPIRRVEIPKPDGVVRLLGIPTWIVDMDLEKFFDRVNHDN
ncbi:MAG: hypothetical protein ACOY3C_02620 [Bacillota bacterium]